jgi:hypothetical protein
MKILSMSFIFYAFIFPAFLHAQTIGPDKLLDKKEFDKFDKVIKKEQDDKKKLISLFNSYNGIDPNSCEAIYYGLFLKNKGAYDATKDLGVDKLSKLSEKILNETKETYFSILPIGAITIEWLSRMNATRIIGQYYPSCSSFLNYSTTSGNSLATKNSRGLDIKKYLIGKDYSPGIDIRCVFGAKEHYPREVFLIAHELSHLVDWAPDDVTSCLQKEGAIKARPFSIKDQPKRSSGFNFNEGMGTELVNQFEGLSIEEAKKLLSKLKAEGKLPDQMFEAVADLWATMIITEYIRGNYASASDRKKEALEVLLNFPPLLYDPEREEIMNEVSSKKTNERRVFGILLANTEFRGLIDCNIAKPINTYLNCAEVGSLNKFKTPEAGNDYFKDFNDAWKRQNVPIDIQK